MNIALIGYGKMGRAIEEIALQKGHAIVMKIDIASLDNFTDENLQYADVAIEFTGPHSAAANLTKCFNAGVPVVCGSTGWLQHKEEMEKLCRDANGTYLYASNFSVGVNLFFELNKYLACLMNTHPEYDIAIEEIHHTEKKDAPSGTAITLAEQILENNHGKKNWVNRPGHSPEELTVTSKRIDPAPGTHIIRYASAIDDIEITHTAHSRKGFATGAVLAAEFVHGKKGIFTMKEVLGL